MYETDLEPSIRVVVNGAECSLERVTTMPTRTWTAIDSEGNAYTMTWADGQGNGQALTPADAEWKFYLTTEIETYHTLDKSYLPTDAVYEDDIANFVKFTDIATADKTGVVKSSDAVNNVTVNTDGTMTVNSLNVDRLVQTGYIILNGGNAALDFPIENN